MGDNEICEKLRNIVIDRFAKFIDYFNKSLLINFYIKFFFILESQLHSKKNYHILLYIKVLKNYKI